MEYRTLGRTDLHVSRLAFGCEPLGGTDWGRVDEDQVIEAVMKALDHGINLFDTADVYGLGHSEEILAKALGSRRRDVIISTKFGINWQKSIGQTRSNTFRDSSPRRVVEALEQSLRRLQLDCIPLYFVHWPDPNTTINDTMEAMLRCRDAGKIRCIGLSNFPLNLIREADQIADLAAVQLGYSVLDHESGAEVRTFCREHKIGILAYGTLAQGLLTGKFNSSTVFGENDRRARLPHFQTGELTKNLKAVDRLREVGKSRDRSPAEVAIRWVLDDPAVSCAIVGAKTPEQVETNAGSFGWCLSQYERDYIASGIPNGQSAAIGVESHVDS
jgi:aryl-alcohol dehydrogenase-like predicted oxidoreductase